jgi:hypothetical protein
MIEKIESRVNENKAKACTGRCEREKRDYLYDLETIGHHGNQHVYQNYNTEHVVGHEQSLANKLYERVGVHQLRTLGRTDSEEGPEEGGESDVKTARMQNQQRQSR